MKKYNNMPKAYEDMTKEELQEELADRDLPISGKKSVLIARLEDEPEASPDEEEEEEEEEDIEEEEEEEEEVPAKTKGVDVIDKAGNYVRTYEKERHGKNFKKIAQEFAKHKGFKVVKRNPKNPNR